MGENFIESCKLHMNIDRPYYKCLLPLAVIYITLALATLVFDLKIFSFLGFPMAGGVLLFPVVFTLSDVITEVYGYQISRQLVWLLIGAQLFFGISVGLFAHVPIAKPVISRDIYFNQTLSPLLIMVLGAPIIICISSFLNIYVLSKFKLLLKGRYFWSRCVFSSAMGDAVCSIMAIFWMYARAVPITQVFLLVTTAYLMKIFYAVVFAIPATILARILKSTEKIDVYDYDTDFNPFHFLIKDQDE